MKNVTVINHPLVQHNLAQLRDKRTQPQEFRRLLGEISALMIYEATSRSSCRPEHGASGVCTVTFFTANVRVAS